MIKELIHRPVTKLSVLISGFGFTENRRHPRAKVKWPVVMTTPNGLVDGQARNISLGGVCIRCPGKPDLEDNFRLVITTKDRLILVNAEVIWSNGHRSHGKTNSHGMGIRFTKISSDDRSFIRGVISGHT